MAAQNPQPATLAAPSSQRAAKTADEPPVTPADPSVEPADADVEFRALAQSHALAALKALASLMANATSEAVRVSAANSLIDRAHGRPAQALRVGARGDEEDGGELTIAWLSPEKS